MQVVADAGEDHRFIDVEEDMALLVVFAPAYGSGVEAAPV